MHSKNTQGNHSFLSHSIAYLRGLHIVSNSLPQIPSLARPKPARRSPRTRFRWNLCGEFEDGARIAEESLSVVSPTRLGPNRARWAHYIPTSPDAKPPSSERVPQLPREP
eukprot:235428-Amphidinium_carterae.2